jgi:hypothetical protein
MCPKGQRSRLSSSWLSGRHAGCVTLPNPVKGVGVLVRSVWPLIVLVLVLGACSSDEVVDSTSTSTATTVLSSTTTSSLTVSTSTTTTTTSSSFEPARLPLAADWVVGSDQGIFLVASGDIGAVVQLWDQPTSLAFMLGDDLVVAQGTTVSDSYPRLAEGPIIVFDSTGNRPLPMDEERLVLLDAGVVDGRPVAVATSETGNGPDETDQRLVLIDLITGERTDLGSVGGWESGVAQARLAEQGVVLLTVGDAQQQVVVRSLTGADEWTHGIGFDTLQALTVKDFEVILLQPGFTDPGFTPALTMDRYELADGSNLGSTTFTLQPPDDVRIEGGFCFTAEWVEEILVCDQTYGGPLRINTSGAVDFLGDFEQGVVTVPRVGS